MLVRYQLRSSRRTPTDHLIFLARSTRRKWNELGSSVSRLCKTNPDAYDKYLQVTFRMIQLLVRTLLLSCYIFVNSSSTALHHCTPFCCDRCHDFKFECYFLGNLYTGNEPKPAKIKIRSTFKNRGMKQRGPLQTLIHAWRDEAHRTDPLRAIRKASWIIDDAKIKRLSIILPERIQIPSDIAQLIGETKEWSSEWALKLFDVIHSFDNPPDNWAPPSAPPTAASDEPPRKRKKSDTAPALPQKALEEKTNTYVRTSGRNLRSSTRKHNSKL